jgi:hypothetical protein
MPEPPEPRKKMIVRAWDVVSHNPLWIALLAPLLVAAIIAHSGGVFGGSSGTPSNSARPTTASAVRFEFHPVAPEVYAVAFDHAIGLPTASEQWETFHNRGGIDVEQSNFRVALSNPSTVPLYITSIEAVVRGLEPRPTASLARVFTQGEESIRDFRVELASAAVGTTAHFQGTKGEDFFRNYKITLTPSETYIANVAVVDYLPGVIEYGFVITEYTPRGLVHHPTPYFRIGGAAGANELTEYTHVYYWLREHSRPGCWIRAQEASGAAFPRCP